jgi:hypothetical protein
MFFRAKAVFAAVFVALLGGCVTDGQPEASQVAAPPAAPEAPPLTTPDSHSESPKSEPGELLALPIDPIIAKRYTHLRPYQGHLLLGVADLQLVIAGASAFVDLSVTWQPVVLAGYELRHGVWQLKSALGRVDLAPVGTGAGVAPVAYHAAAIDTGVDKAANVARAGIVLVAEGEPRQLVQIHLDGATHVMTMTIDDYATPGRPSDRPWKLRLRAPTASDVVGEERQLGGLTGVPYVVRHDGGDVIGVVAYRVAQSRDHWGEFFLEPDTPRAGAATGPAVEGYEIALTRAAVANVHARLAAVESCLYGAQRPKKILSDAARATWLATCKAERGVPAATLTLPEGDAGGSAAPQPVYVFDENGVALTYNALYAGESVAVTLPAGRRLQFADTRSGRLIDGSVPLDLTVQAPADAAATAFALTLPARRARTMRLSLAAGDVRAAFVSVSRLDMPRGHALAVAFSDDDKVVRLGNGLFLVKDWPLQLKLIEGGYQVDVARGGDGTFCTLRLTVAADRPDRVTCPKPTFTTAIPGLADQTTIDAALAAPEDPKAYDAARAAFGARLFTTPLTVAAPTPNVVESIPVLRLDDDRSGMTLQLAPADAALVERWAAEPQGEGQERLERFARFARREAPDGWLELGCPVAMPAAEYRHLVERLDPDAVRAYGCWDAAERDAIIAAPRTGSPLQLTTVSVLQDATQAGFFPRLVLSGSVASPADAAAALKRGAFGISAGAVISNPEVKGVGAAQTVSFDLAASRESRPRYVVLYTELGRFKRETLAEVGDEAVKMQVSFTLPNGARYLRIEVKGSPRRSSMSRMFDLDEGVVMAATNFLPLNAPKRQAAP